MQEKGILFTFENNIAFSNEIISNNVMIYIGGIGCNMLSCEYFNKLWIFCDKLKIKLIFPQFDSHPNYSIFPIERDLNNLYTLINNIGKDKNIILLGHSTGCQDILLFYKKYPNVKINKIILQGPVSDVEYMENEDKNLSEIIEKAKKSKYIEYCNEIYLSERFLSLYERFGKKIYLAVIYQMNFIYL